MFFKFAWRFLDDKKLSKVIKMSELNGEEKEILDAFNEGKLSRSNDFHWCIEKRKQYAESVFRRGTGTLHGDVEGA